VTIDVNELLAQISKVKVCFLQLKFS
jgi:hypothetical protein